MDLKHKQLIPTWYEAYTWSKLHNNTHFVKAYKIMHYFKKCNVKIILMQVHMGESMVKFIEIVDK
jgi:hypothetical protein